MPPKKSKCSEPGKPQKKLKEESDILLWHNPKCSKSRETLKLLKDRNINPEIYKYLEETPSEKQVRSVLKKLSIPPRELLRTTEAVYKSRNLKDKILSDDDLITVMVNEPILIQRPILVSESEARIGRPPQQVLEIINKNNGSDESNDSS